MENDTTTDQTTETTTTETEKPAPKPTAPKDNGDTQKTFDRDYVQSIREEAKAARLALKEAQTKNDQLEADLAERAKTADQTKAELAEAKRYVAATEAATAAGIPPHFASRLHGTTAEELAADAAELAKHLGNPDVGQSGTPASKPPKDDPLLDATFA